MKNNDNSNNNVTKDFFISYAVEDWKQAKWIHQQLETHGYRTILAGRDFKAGNNFVLEMDNALKTSAAMIAIVSSHYLTSPYTQAEWAAVFPRDPTGTQGLIIPVLVQPCEVEGLLGPLLRINLIDLIGKDDQQAQKRLLQGVRHARRTPALTTTFSGKKIALPSSSICNVPLPRNPLFTGREDLLDQLHQKLMGDGDATTATVAALTQPQALKGLGGIGKTQMAIEYAYRYQDHYPYILWVNAATEEALFSSFVAIAGLLPAFSTKDELDQNKVVEAIKQWLEQSDTRWLLIFDNADDVPLVRPFLPKRGNGSILLTTRAHAVSSIAASLEVEKMSLMEGSCLLLRRVYGLAPRLSPLQVLEYASAEDVNEAGNIVAVLDYLPLALDQAGAYVEETGCGFSGYLEVYQTHRKDLLARRGTQATNYPDAVATTWSISFQKVEQANPAAAELLHLCAFLAPDAIPEELIREGAAQWSPLLRQAAANSFTVNEMMSELLKFSLVHRLAEQSFSIHRLVQAVQRDKMEPETQRQWAERMVRAINVAFPKDSGNMAVWPQCRRYLDQAQACYALIEHYKFAFVEVASVLNRTALYLYDHALYSIAEPLHQRALAVVEQQLGATHLETASSLNNLALLYQHQGRYEEAEPLLLRALRICEQQLGDTHPDTGTSLNSLASLYYMQGRYSEAESLYRRALSIHEQQLGADHPETSSSFNNLALLYESQGKYAQAESLYQHALVVHEQQLGASHPETAGILNNLALLYENQGKHDQAEPLLQRALAIREEQLGASNPDTANSLNSLAALYSAQGKYNEAESFHKRALAIAEQQLGASHPHTATTLSSLATLYYMQEKYNEAEPLHKRALAIREEQLGADHPETAQSLSNLASLYHIQGQYSEVELLLRRALSICEQQLGASHLDTAHYLNNLAVFYQAQKRYNEAEPLYQRALVIREQQLGASHPETAQSLSNLASLYYAQNQYSKAELLLRRALSICEQQLGRDHPTTQTFLENYSLLLQTRERDIEARPSEEGS